MFILVSYDMAYCIVNNIDKIRLGIFSKLNILLTVILISLMYFFFYSAFNTYQAYLLIPLITYVLTLFLQILLYIYTVKFNLHSNVYKWLNVFLGVLRIYILSIVFSFSLVATHNVYINIFSIYSFFTLMSMSLLAGFSLIDKQNKSIWIHETSLFSLLFLIGIIPLFMKYIPYILQNYMFDSIYLILLIGYAYVSIQSLNRRITYGIYLPGLTIFLILLMHLPYIVYPLQTIYSNKNITTQFFSLILLLLVFALITTQYIFKRKNVLK